jgi:hypothetical protein
MRTIACAAAVLCAQVAPGISADTTVETAYAYSCSVLRSADIASIHPKMPIAKPSVAQAGPASGLVKGGVSGVNTSTSSMPSWMGIAAIRWYAVEAREGDRVFAPSALL